MRWWHQEHTVIVVEHDMRVVAGSDWVMDIARTQGTKADA
jgi:excinuclease UvrABC ATPase subunit